MATFKALEATTRELETLAMHHNSALVSFSGGKDSLVCLDLAKRHFPRVVCFFMYLVEGLEIAEKMLADARERYGVEVLQYPH